MTNRPLTDHYSVFGLRVQSDLELPELFRAERDHDPDVVIRRGPVRPGTSKTGMMADNGDLVLVVPEVARYRISGGREIVVDPDPAAPRRNVSLFLMGSAFGALLHQRGLLPLHANAVEVNGRAAAFMGPSGAGKSTLAACFHQRGYRIVADDVCVVRFGDAGHAQVAPGLPRLRLWAQSLEAIGRETKDLQRSYVGSDGELEKFDLPITRSTAVTSEVPLGGLYVLERGDEFAVRQLNKAEAAEAVLTNTYRGSYVQMTKTQKCHWEASIKLIQQVPVYVVTREWDLKKIDSQNAHLLNHFAGGL